jgi:D-tyrosyl-tRNA(Tyr) deacylase
MRLVIQRVKNAKVAVKETGKIVGKISEGLFALLGISKEDTVDDVEKLVEKLSKLRILSDKEDKMNLSLEDTKCQVLVVSQFTLYADTSKGNRPSFIKAAHPKLAKKLYEDFVDALVKKDIKTETGEFGAYMLIDCELDGPVTIVIES